MRIHSDLLTHKSITESINAIPNGPRVAEISQHKSRSRKASFDIFLTGHGLTGGQWGNTSGLKTASWDEWGAAFATLYDIDAELSATPYPFQEEFELITYGRFAAGEMPEDTHHYHKWDYTGTLAAGRRMFDCRGTKKQDCSARMCLPKVNI